MVMVVIAVPHKPYPPFTAAIGELAELHDLRGVSEVLTKPVVSISRRATAEPCTA